MAEIELKTIETVSNQPFRKLVTTIGELPSAFIESMSYYEMLAWLVNWLENTVIPTVNNNAEAVEELQGLFVELKTFVDNYFDNLDVQEEINNKLDDMSEDGTLQSIVYDYLNSVALFTYDTVADMKLATNFINGSYAKTLGYYTKNDGGTSTYKIRTVTDQDVIDEGKIIALANPELVAELVVKDSINIKQFGAVCDGITDDTSHVQHMIDSISDGVKTIIFNNSEDLIISDVIDFSNQSNLNIIFKGKIKRTSAESTSICFKVWQSKNLVFENSNIDSTRDQQETPPADHTRVSPYGSNIIGYHISGSENITFKNCIFNNMMSDFYNQPYNSTDSSLNVTIDNWYSRNSSLPLFMQYIKNVYISNADIIPANDMGDGDHFLYFSKYVDTVYVDNCKFKNDDANYGSAIQYFNSGSGGTDANCPKNLIINNCYFDICARVLTIQYSTNAKILNCNIHYQDEADYGFTAYNTSNLVIDNCNITGYIDCFYPGSGDTNIQIKNSSIINAKTSPSYFMQHSVSGEPTIILQNNFIKWNNGLWYSSNAITPHLYIENNVINQDSTSNQLLSVRKTAGDVFFNYNIVNLAVTAPRLIYNNIAANNFNVYFNELHGYTALANTTDITTINNNYNII